MMRNAAREILVWAMSGMMALWATGCSHANVGGGGTPPGTNNVLAISVNTGPTAAMGSPYINGAFTSVTVCVPGSTTQCQTIDGILVDTGSPGLRLLSSELTVALPQQTDSSNNPVVECAPFASGVIWGPVQTADMTVTGEKASSLPIQVIGTNSFPNIPAACSNQGTPVEDLQQLGANGILGIGPYQQDCGAACATSGATNPGVYYTCPATGCVVAAEPLASQVTNPVVMFPKDNNGTIIELPALSGSAASVNGQLIFGIGTQSNNGLGSATIYTMDPASGNFSTVFNGQTYTNEAFLDSGSNAMYFLDSTTTTIPTCTDYTFWYCPGGTLNFSATNMGANGNSGIINFSVGNADSLVANPGDGAANGLAGPFPSTFDWGLPFFYGRNVYTAIDGMSTPGGTGPYWAY
ncbi:MAG TPA: DUF3443 domain-containing protein [Candidatus Acidoferrales bacterium]|nr:DUF3443 domain-containing protein [Candidatus Acidoferrales bacterium]